MKLVVVNKKPTAEKTARNLQIVKHYFNGKKKATIALMYGMSRENVDVLIHRYINKQLDEKTKETLNLIMPAL